MKKITTLLVSLLLPVILLAQNAPLSIKGIPIEGKASEFAYKLVQKGFVMEYEDLQNPANGYITMKGPFMNRPNTTFYIYTTEDAGIKMVLVTLEGDDNWTSIESLYQSTVETYKVKYGEPTERVEEFVDGKTSSNAFLRYMYLKNGECDYHAKWVIDEARLIAIHIQYQKYKPFVVIGYVPSIERAKQEVYDDI